MTTTTVNPIVLSDVTGHNRRQEPGSHQLCAQVTREFLDFSLSRGIDLVTPIPGYGFSGLKPGDHWSISIDHWLEALDAGVAPPIIVSETNADVLEILTSQSCSAL